MTVLGERAARSELIDRGGHDPGELSRSLDHVAAVNRFLGGDRALRRHLSPLRTTRPDARVLDVGTGNGRVLASILRWARRGGARWRGVGLELSPEMLAAAGPAGAPALVRGDGLSLPFADASFDAVLCTLTLHHFRDDTAADLVAEMARVSRGVVVVNDLERCLPNYMAARLLAVTWWRGNALTRHDGPLSVLRGWTPGELERIARAAGLEGARVVRRFPFRLILEARAS